MKKMIVLLQSAVVFCTLVFTGCGTGQEGAPSSVLSEPESFVSSDTMSNEQPAVNVGDEAGANLEDTVLYEGVIAEVGEGNIGLRRLETTYGEDDVDAAAGGFNTPIDTFTISANTVISVRNVSRATEEVTISDGSVSDLKAGSTAYVFYKQEGDEQLAIQITVVNIY